MNSTSAGATTIDLYVQRELGDEELVFEDPDYQMTASLPPHSSQHIDLEKNVVYRTDIARTDSGYPRRVSEGNDGGSAGQIGTQTSHIDR